MVAITDKFGKASINSDYAIATTVKTTRAIGTLVTEAYDLSKFANDTPVYYVTYKKSIDPTTGDAIVINLVSWKAIVNTSANTLTNMQLAPGYTDLGNDEGDFIECIPTSHWENNLIDGILAHTNQDGTLKTSAVQAALNLPAGASPDWTVLATPPNTVVYNGQRSYTMTFNGVDYTDRIHPGTRLKTVRAVPAPTQCTSLNGTTQYMVKTSPNKMTFTTSCVADAYIKIPSYGDYTVESRLGASSGWKLQINPSGQVVIVGYSGGYPNSRSAMSYQSIPLNKWVRITAQLDMATNTNTPTTNYIMIDGTDVPCVMGSSGTNPTSIVQQGNYEIGSFNGGTVLFNGKIAQVAIFGAKVTQDQMRNYASQGYTGTEANLLSAYSFDGNTNDLNTTSPNSLTAMGSAGYSPDSPFGTQSSGLISSTLDYGLVGASAFSTNTVVTVQVPEGCAIPTIGAVNAIYYSGIKAPYGMPTTKVKWRVQSALKTFSNNGAININSYMNIASFRLLLPIGDWGLGYSAYTLFSSPGATYCHNAFSLSTSPISFSSDLENSRTSSTSISANVAQVSTFLARETPYSAASATTAYLVAQALEAVQTIYIDGVSVMAIIYADNALL